MLLLGKFHEHSHGPWRRSFTSQKRDLFGDHDFKTGFVICNTCAVLGFAYSETIDDHGPLRDLISHRGFTTSKRQYLWNDRNVSKMTNDTHFFGAFC